MQDIDGTEFEVGQQVAYIDNEWGVRHRLKRGQVIKITPKMIRVGKSAYDKDAKLVKHNQAIISQGV